ncbi:sporulation-delaying protein SdpB family protein [Kitasatospora sp. GAS204B]|uniref:sporulation-delaying protein SdpB family protein n=1 Tax=unclassified Kitasatospora TaxID=2633591 RepID=UPI0024763055|nr:sporulation-delaying protein SdpB family protein [Kitasatospora sp. GAS204B]MDH6118945.1 antimicrobial peptide system SdpB family protein [Kitasatospora sp. GAS204B]
MRRLTDRALASAASFDPRGLPLAFARSVLALSELISIVFTPDHSLFTYQPGLSSGMRCYGAHDLSLWCVAGSTPAGLLSSRLIAIAVLVLVVSGYRPRWTCAPHWFVTWSLSVSMTMPSGAEEAALAGTMLMMPFLLGDTRIWHWTRPSEPLAPVWAGSSYAAWWAIRCQIAIIYFTAGISKLCTAQWRSGHAMYTVLVDPFYGLPPGIRQALGPLLASESAIRLLTWGALAIELAIAAAALSPRRARRTAFCLAVLLHGGIMVAMGLVSFGLVMIALVLTLLVGDSHTLALADASEAEAADRPLPGDFQPMAMNIPAEIMEIR